MNAPLDRIRPISWIPFTLVAAALASCVPAPARAPTSAAGAMPTRTPAPTELPIPMATSAPTAGPKSTLAPRPPTPVPTSAPVTITHIKMFDITTGWAEGQVGTEEETRILRTTDGGMTWSEISPERGADYRGSFFLDAQLAWVFAGYGGPAWRTQDGGQSWVSLEGSPWWQDEIWFNDGQHGWKVNGEAFGMSFPGYDIDSFSTTQDGGQTWEAVIPPTGGGFPFLAFPDERTAWVIWGGKRAAMEGWANLGVPIRVLTSFDGGMTWISRMLPLPAETFTVETEYEGNYLGGGGNCTFISPVYSSTAIWKAALTCETRSWMYTSANQGKTWIISPMPAGLYADIQFINPTVGWLFVLDWDDRQGRLYQTTDGGQSWTLLKRTGWMDVEFNFVDAQIGWAVACTETLCHNFDAVFALVKTSDGGQTWTILQPRLVP